MLRLIFSEPALSGDKAAVKKIIEDDKRHSSGNRQSALKLEHHVFKKKME